MRQHMIDRTAPPITDDMTDHAPGAGSDALVGTVGTAYDIPDSTRCETLLLFDDGHVVLVSCDPITHAEDGTRLPPEQWGHVGWEVVLYDATDTRAGHAIRELESGQWL